MAAFGKIDHGPPGSPDPENFFKKFHYGFVWVHGNGQTRGIVPLNLNPQQIEMTEPFATSIAPLQGAGKFIERRGIIFKHLQISGTTGGVNEAAFNGVPPAAPFFTISPTVARKSGFAYFHRLRGLFRSYAEVFRTGGTHATDQLLWVNLKDNEIYVVEPITFKMRRAPGFLYTYDISCEVIGSWTGVIGFPVPARSKISDYAGVIAEATAVRATARQLTTDAKGLGLPNARQLLSSTVAGALPTNNAIESFSALRENLDRANLQQTPLAWLSSLNEKFNEAIDDILNPGYATLISGFSNAYSQFMSTAFNVSARLVDLINGQGPSVIAPILGVLQTINTIRRDLTKLFSLAKRNWATNAGYLSDEWSSVIEGDYTFGLGKTKDPSNPGNLADVMRSASSAIEVKEELPLIVGMREETLRGGETGYQFAARTTGRATSWVVIVRMNGLVPPYIVDTPVQDTNEGLSRPGDRLLVPAFEGETDYLSVGRFRRRGESVTIRVASYNTLVVTAAHDQNWLEDRWAGYTLVDQYGETRSVLSSSSATIVFDRAFTTAPASNDLMTLRSESAPDRETARASSAAVLKRDMKIVALADGTFDLALSDSGDVGAVEGDRNLVQAIGIKLRSRYGDHPMLTSGSFGFGLDVEPGTKASNDNLFDYEAQVLRTLLSDDRILSVEGVSVSYEKGQLRMDVSVQTKAGTLAFTS